MEFGERPASAGRCEADFTSPFGPRRSPFAKNPLYPANPRR